MLPVVAIALVAAFLFATAASLQQHAAHQTGYRAQTTRPAPSGRGGRRPLVPLVRLVGVLVHRRLWLAGWLTNLFGFLTQAVALYLGSVAVVQPVLVTELLFSLPLASVWARRWPTARDWLSGAAITVGLVLFLTGRGAPAHGGLADRERFVLAGLSALVLAVLLLIAAAGRTPLVHGTLVAVAAGVYFAMSAALMKLTGYDLVHRGIAATATDWPGYALAFSTLLGLLLEQGAFAAGTLPSAVAAMTITNPLVSYVIGTLAFGVTPPTSPAALAALSAAVVLVTTGVVGLSHSPGGRVDPGPTAGPEGTRKRGSRHGTRDGAGRVPGGGRTAC